MKIRSIPLLFLLLSLAGGSLSAADYRLAVAATRGQEDIKLWQSFAAYLSQETGESFTVTALPPVRIDNDFESGAISLAVTNPVSAIEILEAGAAKPLATVKSKGLTQFAGVIIAKTGSGIKTAADIKGRSVIAFQTSSAGAYVFQMQYVIKNGLDPNKDFASIRKANKQDDIVMAVGSGTVDVGFIRSGLLETMAKEGKVKLTDFVVVDAKNDDLKLLHSTPLYPEWSLLASNKLDPALIAKIKAAALKLRASDAGAKDAGIDGFVEPLSLDGVKDAMKTLRLPPFDK